MSVETHRGRLGTTDERYLTEPWAQRKARLAAERAAAKLPVTNCRPFLEMSEADQRRLRQLWTEGMLVRRIALELGCSRTTVQKARKALGLPTRSRKGLGPLRTRSIHVCLTEEHVKQVERLCKARGKTIATFIATLVARELDSHS